MKVIYAGLDAKKLRKLIESEPDVIILLFDRWNDFSYQTAFPTKCHIKEKEVGIGGIKILIAEEATSFAYLDKLVEKGWDGVFPIPNTVYISTPDDLSFYEQIEGNLGLEEAIGVAQALHDASYLVRIKEDKNALRLVTTAGFRKSLQRERGSIKAYLDGWKFFGKETIAIKNQTFRFESVTGELLSLELKFYSKNPLPHDINVLIGPNGVGKSQLLKQIVKNWLQLEPGENSDVGFAERPNLNQLVVVSYSPFENFPVDTSEDKERKDHDVYKYFGLRGRKSFLTDSKRGSSRVTLSREFPRANAARSLLDCVAGDQKFGVIRDWSKKVQTMEQVLKTAIDFDRAAVEVNAASNVDDFFSDKDGLDQPYIDEKVIDKEGKRTIKRYVPISSDRIEELKVAVLSKHLHDRSGVLFFKNNKQIHLSSGQRLFSYIVINILGTIRRNSLILVDEPELFLHPSLEIAFLRMLKSILASYGSKALVATHSLVTVREIPRDCVHVLEMTKDGIKVKTPPFETFGGDIQRISSYVFGDKSLSKPYEEWVEEQLKEYGSAELLIEALGQNVNEELLIQINSMGRNQW